MNRSSNKVAARRSVNTHDQCKSCWKQQRKTDHKPNPLIKKNQKHYQKLSKQAATSRVNDIIKHKDRNQMKILKGAMNDIERWSLLGKRIKDHEGQYKITILNDKQANRIDKQRYVQKIMKQSDQAKRIENIRKHKYYFLQNLRQGHPKYSPYRMFQHEIKIHHPIIQPEVLIKYDPRTYVYPQYYDSYYRPTRIFHFDKNQQKQETFQPILLTPRRENKTPSKYHYDLQTTRSIEHSSKRLKTDQPTIKLKNQMLSQDQLNNLMQQKKQDIIKFFMDMIKKQ